jgi:hypothetical protein
MFCQIHWNIFRYSRYRWWILEKCIGMYFISRLPAKLFRVSNPRERTKHQTHRELNSDQ